MDSSETEAGERPVPGSYLRVLEEIEGGGSRPPARRERAARLETGLRVPRRRAATESLRVRLAPEQLYWLRLAAARAGDKIDESAIVAAGLAILEELDLDWRTIGSRSELAARLTRALAPRRPPAPPAAAREP
jgi:hypothetical protein